MRQEDANLVLATVGVIVGLAGVIVGSVATAAAVYAIRRDRADLRVTSSDAAAGNRYITVVNVGLRPVRIERALARRWKLLPMFSTERLIRVSVMGERALGHPFPMVLQPAEEVVLHYWAGDIDLFTDHRADIVVMDASGRRYPVRAAPTIRFGPPNASDDSDQGAT